MKYNIKYLILILSLYACEKIPHTQQPPSETINEFLIIEEEMESTIARSSVNDNKEFISGDSIRLYGYSKQIAGAETPAQGRERFMPEADGISGATYKYSKDQTGGWHRFFRDESTDQIMGFWRVGFFHDFSAYYSEITPTTGDSIRFIMSSRETNPGLVPKNLLWGESRDIYFSGDAQIIPKIRFYHQLSRVRVEVMHDMPPVAIEDICIDSIKFDLAKSGATFNLETGLWRNWVDTPITIAKEFSPSDGQMDDTKFPRLKFIEIADLWVLPHCTLSDFKFYLTQGTNEKDFEIDFKDLFNDNGDEPTEIITKPGYVTTLRIQFGEIKQIIYTISLQPWHRTEVESIIKDDNLVN